MRVVTFVGKVFAAEIVENFIVLEDFIVLIERQTWLNDWVHWDSLAFRIKGLSKHLRGGFIKVVS